MISQEPGHHLVGGLVEASTRWLIPIVVPTMVSTMKATKVRKSADPLGGARVEFRGGSFGLAKPVTCHTWIFSISIVSEETWEILRVGW